MEIKSIKKQWQESTLEIEKLGKRSGVIEASITNKIQEMEERPWGAEDRLENIDTTVKEHARNKKRKEKPNLLTQNIQEIQDTMRRQS